jgi:hypothetical protein
MNYKTYNKLVRVRILPLILLLAAARANADCSLSDPTVHVRRDIYHLAKTPAGQATIDSLRKGVSAMMRRPESDPTSWLSQANIHGIAPGDATHPLEKRRAGWPSPTLLKLPSRLTSVFGTVALLLIFANGTLLNK